MGPLGWIAIGCGVILILGIIGFGGTAWFAKRKFDEYTQNPAKAAALLLRANPDLEVVSTDDKAKTVTVRNKKDNEVTTLSLDDIRKGKFKVTTNKGTATFDGSAATSGGGIKVTDEKGQTTTLGGGTPENLPSWLPVYPGATSQGAMSSTTNEGRSGGFSVTTKDSIEQVANYYESQFKAAGLKVEKNMISSNDKTSGGTVSGTSDDKKRTAAVILSTADTGTQGMVTYEEKK
jgi:hypothetical protein